MNDTHRPAGEIGEIAAGLFSFIERDVLPLQRSLGDVFDDPRRYWRLDGRLGDEVVAARRAVRTASARAGYYTMFCPIELGGGGLGAVDYFTVWEELCFRYGSPQSALPFYVLAHTSTGPTALWAHASEELQTALLPQLVKGEIQGTFAMSEPDAGSDAWMMSTRAVRDGNDWIITGQKQWASWGPTADFAITFAVTDPEQFAQRRGGLTCFYVPAESPGYRLDSVVKIFDEVGGEECIISFDEVRIPDSFRIGPVGQGFPVAMQGAGQLKLTKLGRSIGLARWANERAIEYALMRRTFGATLAEHQGIQNMLAENAIELHAATLMAKDLAARIDSGQSSRQAGAMTYAYTFEAMYRVYDRAMQIFGGMGISNDLGMIHGWHTLRACRITEGPTEIQLRTVARQVLKRAPDQSRPSDRELPARG